LKVYNNNNEKFSRDVADILPIAYREITFADVNIYDISISNIDIENIYIENIDNT